MSFIRLRLKAFSSKDGRSFRTRKLLLEPKLRTLLGLRRFSESENLLYSLAKDPFLLAVFFAPHGLSAKSIRQMQRVGKRDSNENKKRVDALSLRKVLTHARVEAKGLSHDVIGIEHLLLTLLRHDVSSARLLDESGLTYGPVRQAAEGGLSSLYLEFRLPKPKFYSARVRR
jgi:hypothetical protein